MEWNEDIHTIDISEQEGEYRMNKLVRALPSDILKQKTKREARKILENFIERVHHCNQAEIGHLQIAKVWVFGSFLYKEKGLNDLDVFICLDYLVPSKVFSTEADTVAIDNMFSFIKGGEDFLNISSYTDGVFNRCEKKLVYEYLGIFEE